MESAEVQYKKDQKAKAIAKKKLNAKVATGKKAKKLAQKNLAQKIQPAKPKVAKPVTKKPVKTANPNTTKGKGKAGSDSDLKPKILHPMIKKMNSKFKIKLKPAEVKTQFNAALNKHLKDFQKLGKTVPHE